MLIIYKNLQYSPLGEYTQSKQFCIVGLHRRTSVMNSVSTKEIKVFIVEDYKLTRIGLRATLNKFEGIRVIGEAEDAESALEKIKDERPDVVLMDLGLPGMNGFEATQKARALYPDIHVVILTSHERGEEVLAALGSGACSYCLKDIEPPVLAEVIKYASEGTCWIDADVAKGALSMFPKPDNLLFFPRSGSREIKAQLTDREAEVLRLLVQGKSNTEIAEDLIVSVHTAKAHVCSILQKLCVDDRVQAAVKAVKENII